MSFKESYKQAVYVTRFQREVWSAGMYEFDLVLLLLQQMCVFLVIAWLMSKTPLFIPLMQVTVRLPHKLLCYVAFSIFCILGTCFGLHIDDSIANTRAIGAVMGGLLGGPVVGGLVGLTGGLTPLLAGRHDRAELHGINHRRRATRRAGTQYSGQTRAARTKSSARITAGADHVRRRDGADADYSGLSPARYEDALHLVTKHRRAHDGHQYRRRGAVYAYIAR